MPSWMEHEHHMKSAVTGSRTRYITLIWTRMQTDKVIGKLIYHNNGLLFLLEVRVLRTVVSEYN